jgi:hypothetical protein
MRNLFTLMLVAVTVLALAACGGNSGNATNSGNHDHDHDHEHGHGHGDEHGEAHSLGEKDLDGGYHVHAAVVGELHDAKEGVFEVKVTKDDKPAKGAMVTAWIVDTDGKESGHATGEWNEKESFYDCHVALAKEPGEGAKLVVRVMHEGTDAKATFNLPHDEH